MLTRSFLVLALLWLIGILRFVTLIPTDSPQDYGFTDGVAVLTGGSKRVIEGMIIIQQQLARTMLISGVGGGADIEQLTSNLDLHSAELSALKPFITLDYESVNTQGNALAIRQWVDEKQLQHIRLITSNYHMPRAMLELRQHLPYLPVTEHPVFTSAFRLDDWWMHSNSALLLLSEYHKWLYAGARYIMHKINGSDHADN